MYGPYLEGEHITLAPPAPSYVADYLRWFADPEVTRYLLLRNPPSLEQEHALLAARASDPDNVFWSILLGDRHIGSTGIESIHWRNRSARTGIVIGERDHWGHGYATEAMRLRTDYAFRELGLESLATQVFAPNEGSRRALLRAGYREVGWLRRAVYFEGQFHDIWLAQIIRPDWEAARAQTAPASPTEDQGL
jgi:ribosomal-protein-alanine N-acetyltransferase